jgi:hypothetical protein
MNLRAATPATAAWAITLIIFLASAVLLSLTRPDSRPNLAQTMGVACFVLLLVAQLRASPPERSPQPDGKRLWAPLLLGALAYLPCLRLYFVSDDFVHLVLARAPLLGHIEEQIAHGQVTETGYHLFFRPVGFASLALDYRLFHLWPAGYHLVNVLLHLCVVAGFFLVCERLGLRGHASLTAAALFAVLPVNAQAVAYVAARFDLLAAALAMWALVLYLRYRNTGSRSSYALALALFFLGTWAKENVFVLPLLIAAMELLLLAPRRWKPLAGLAAVAAASFGYRWYALGGMGGYTTQAGTPATLVLGRKALLALLVRAPSESLMGFDWLQPPAWHITVFAAGIVAIVFALAMFANPSGRGLRVSVFGVLWLVLSAAPAHSLLWSRDPGLVWSRVLYFGSAGLALALAALLDAAPQPGARRAWTALLVLLFVLALEHNLSAWTYNSRATRELLGELQRIEPAPPPGARFVFTGLPDQIRGVRFFFNGIRDAVRLTYRRNDLDASTAAGDATAVAASGSARAIRFRWTGKPGYWIEPAR